jgi:hypothetical protein
MPKQIEKIIISMSKQKINIEKMIANKRIYLSFLDSINVYSFCVIFFCLGFIPTLIDFIKGYKSSSTGTIFAIIFIGLGIGNFFYTQFVNLRLSFIEFIQSDKTKQLLINEFIRKLNLETVYQSNNYWRFKYDDGFHVGITEITLISVDNGFLVNVIGVTGRFSFGIIPNRVKKTLRLLIDEQKATPNSGQF